jgi:WD40 repeat protein
MQKPDSSYLKFQERTVGRGPFNSLLIRKTGCCWSEAPSTVPKPGRLNTRTVPSGGQGLSPKVIGSPKTILGIAAAPAGQTVAFVQDAFDANLRTAVVQDALGRTPPIPLAQIAPAQSVQPLTFTPDGQSIAVLTVDSQIAVGDAATGKGLRSFPIPGQISEARLLALSCEGRWLAVSSESLRGVGIFDFNAGKLRYTLPERAGSVYWLAWDPSDEPRLAIARDNGDISIWDLAKIDQQLADLGLGIAADRPESEPGKN